MKLFCLLPFILGAVPLAAQSVVISQFTWNDIDAGPLKAFIGPDAVSVAGNTTVKARSTEGSGGLVAPTDGEDTNLLLADDDIYDVEGLDLSYDFQRNENEGSIITRGNFLLGDATNFLVRFRVRRPDNTTQTISSGTVYTAPRDNALTDDFINYRFTYTPSTGVAQLIADGTVRWTSSTIPPGSVLDWDANSAFLIGPLIDGSKQGNPVFDNLIFRELESSATLPIELSFFTAKARKDNTVLFNWQTASELDNERFEIERSTDHSGWEVILTQAGAGDSNESIFYEAFDRNPPSGTVYYRLKQIDYDGQYSYSAIEVVEISAVGSAGFSVYPNPAGARVIIQGRQPLKSLRLFDVRGVDVTDKVSLTRQTDLRYSAVVDALSAGVYFLSTESGTIRFYKR